MHASLRSSRRPEKFAEWVAEIGSDDEEEEKIEYEDEQE